jgi:hypothetical protein
MSLLNYAVGASQLSPFLGAGVSLVICLPNAINTWIKLERP